MKLKCPGLFNGISGKLWAFIAEFCYYIWKFLWTFVKEEDKVVFAVTCFEGTAKD